MLKSVAIGSQSSESTKPPGSEENTIDTIATIDIQRSTSSKQWRISFWSLVGLYV